MLTPGSLFSLPRCPLLYLATYVWVLKFFKSISCHYYHRVPEQRQDGHTSYFAQLGANRLCSLLPTGSSAKDESVSRPPEPRWTPCSDEVSFHLLLAVPGSSSAVQCWLSKAAVSFVKTLRGYGSECSTAEPPCGFSERKKESILWCSVLTSEPRHTRRCCSHFPTDTGRKCHASRKH